MVVGNSVSNHQPPTTNHRPSTTNKSMAVSTFAHERPSGVRHRVLWLAVIVYMITYMDRVCISHAAAGIRKEFGFDAVTMGWIFSGFNLSYALFQIPGGWL